MGVLKIGDKVSKHADCKEMLEDTPKKAYTLIYDSQCSGLEK